MDPLSRSVTLASALLATGAWAGTAAAQSAEPPAELVAAAEAEGSLVYYSSEVDAINQAIVEAFEAKYDIDVEWLRLASGPLASRFAEEQNSGGSAADVLRTADGSVFIENEDWFVELTPEVLPALSLYPDSAYLENKRSVLTQYSTYVFTYNTNLVEKDELPETWSDILEPRWHGRVVLSDPRASISWLAWIDAMVKAHGIEFAHGVRDQEWDVVSSAAPGAQQVAAGAYDGSTPAFSGHATPVIQQGAPVDFVTPSDPAILKRDHIGIVKDSAHSNAARLFVNFRLSPEGLEIACGLNQIGSPLADIPGCVATPENPTTVKDVWTPEEAAPLFEALGLQQG